MSAGRQDESETETPKAVGPIRRAAPLLADVAGSSLTAAAGAGLLLFAVRGQLGAALAQDWLAQHGAPATIAIDGLSRDGFSGSVSIGPPGRPDFTAAHVDARFGPDLSIGSLRLVRPHLRLALVDGQLRYGSLQGVMDTLSRPKAPGGPLPDVRIEDATVELSTPAGLLVADGGGVLRGGAVERVDLRLRPARLHADVGFDLALSSGALAGRGTPGGLRLTASAAGERLAVAGGGASRIVVGGWADLAMRGTTPLGPVRAGLDLQAERGDAGGWAARAPAAQATFDGAASGPADRLSITGRGALAARAADLAGPAAGHARAFRAKLALRAGRLELSRRGPDLRIGLELAGSASADRAAFGEAQIARPDLTFSLAKARFEQARATRLLTGAIDARLAAGSVGMDGAALKGAVASIRGPVRLDAGRARFQGSLRASGAADAGLRRRLAAIPGLGSALARASDRLALDASTFDVTTSPGGFSLATTSPVSLKGSGATLTVASVAGSPLAARTQGQLRGALRAQARLAGLDATAVVDHYALGTDHGQARGRIILAGDLGEVRGLRLAADLEARRVGGVTQVRLPGCAQGELGAYATIVASAKARVCPASAPLATLDGRGWRAAFTVSDLQAALPSVQAKIAAAADVSLEGDARGPRQGRLILASLGAIDLAPAPRFAPLTTAGQVDLAAGRWAGRLVLSEAAGKRVVGRLELGLDARSFAGEVRLDTTGLRFAQGGLQPSDITPLASPRLIGKADGPLDLTATARWSRGGLSSEGRVRTAGLDFTGPAGRVHGLKADVVLSSLAPLATPPGQRVAAETVAWLTPLSDLRLQFQLLPTVLRVEAASARAAGGSAGLDALTLSLAPNSPIAGVLRVSGLDAGALVAGSGLADKVKLDARLSGVLPFAIATDGTVRLADGRLAADGPGRLSISRAALTGGVQSNGVQDFAYQALENLAFESLDAGVDSQPKGRLGVLFHVRGRHDPPVAVETRVGLLDLIRGRAFDKPLPLPKGTPVNLTLDTSLNFDELLAAYRAMSAEGPPRSGGVQPDSGVSSAKPGGAGP